VIAAVTRSSTATLGHRRLPLPARPHRPRAHELNERRRPVR